jgi:hypothetical protein
MAKPKIKSDGRTITVRVPISIRKRGGRKVLLAPKGRTDAWMGPIRRVDNAVVKAIARAFRWREMLENGTHSTIAEIAAAEKINDSYVGRILRLTLLSPKVIEGIINRPRVSIKLDQLMRSFPIEWEKQSVELGL